MKFGVNRLLKTGGGDSSQKVFSTAEIRWKPPFLTKRFKDGAMFLRWSVNDYKYDTVLNNYRENSITFGLNCEI